MRYRGGKNLAGTYQKIINQIPPHTTYIEPFLGSGAILRMKKPARSSIAIDRHAAVIAAAKATFEIPDARYICDDAISFLREGNFSAGTFIYLDPPYLIESRRNQGRIYKFEFSEADHIALLEVIQTITADIAISGYDTRLYREALESWRLVQFNANTRINISAIECLWMNYPQPFELHDYRYLGENYRERQRIKRRQQRWKRRLSAMPDLERQALLATIEELRSVDV